MDTVAILNRLLLIHERSLPMYLVHARPWTHMGSEKALDEKALDVFQLIVADQRAMAERISEFIIQAGHQVHTGGAFPLEFTDMHDLAVEFLIGQAVAYQKQDVEAIQSCVGQLRLAPAALSLAEEALGMAKGHLQSLDELLEQPVK